MDNYFELFKGNMREYIFPQTTNVSRIAGLTTIILYTVPQNARGYLTKFQLIDESGFYANYNMIVLCNGNDILKQQGYGITNDAWIVQAGLGIDIQYPVNRGDKIEIQATVLATGPRRVNFTGVLHFILPDIQMK